MAKRVYDEDDKEAMNSMQEYNEDMDSVTPQDVKNLCVTGFPADVFDDVLLKKKGLASAASQTPEDLEKYIEEHSKEVPKLNISGSLLDEAKGVQRFDSAHRSCLEAVFSLMNAGNTCATSAMIFRTMTGGPRGMRVTKTQKKLVDDLMSSMLYSPVSIEMPIIGADGKVEKTFTFESPMIAADRMMMKMSGAVCVAYRFKSSYFYQYCRRTNALIKTPYDMIFVPKLQKTERNISLISFVQRKLANYLYPSDKEYVKPSPLTVDIEEAYHAAYPESDKISYTEKNRIRGNIEVILDTLKENGYIDKWNFVQNASRVKAVRISFPDKVPPVDDLGEALDLFQEE